MNVSKLAGVSQVCLALILSGCSMSTQANSPTPGPPPSSAQTQATAITQPELQVSSQDDPSLTQGEKVEDMDGALARSLNKYDARRNAQTQGGGGASPAGGGAADTAPGAGGAFPELGSGGPVASSEISGTETNPQVPAGALMGSTQVTDVMQPGVALGSPPGGGEEETPDRAAGRVPVGRRPVLGSGKLPEDLPVADNDSVLEAQIRAAAMQEQDPQMRERLWNEYRRYKGLPVQE